MKSDKLLPSQQALLVALEALEKVRAASTGQAASKIAEEALVQCRELLIQGLKDFAEGLDGTTRA